MTPDTATFVIERWGSGEPCLSVSYNMNAREDGSIDIDQSHGGIIRISPEQVDVLIEALQSAQTSVRAILEAQNDRPDI